MLRAMEIAQIERVSRDFSLRHAIVESLSCSLPSYRLTLLKAKGRTGVIAMRPQTAHRQLLAILFVIGGFAHTSIAFAGETDAAVGCELRSEKKNGFLRLTAVARAKIAISGRYHMVVSKHSASGSSENAQSGAFTLVPNHERVLTTTVLDDGASGHYRANLSIDTNAGRVSCSSP